MHTYHDSPRIHPKACLCSADCLTSGVVPRVEDEFKLRNKGKRRNPLKRNPWAPITDETSPVLIKKKKKRHKFKI